ncbi:MAG: hypothetical protein ACYYKD_13765 [Rhodospirillales bacterium]
MAEDIVQKFAEIMAGAESRLSAKLGAKIDGVDERLGNKIGGFKESLGNKIGGVWLR